METKIKTEPVDVSLEEFKKGAKLIASNQRIHKEPVSSMEGFNKVPSELSSISVYNEEDKKVYRLPTGLSSREADYLVKAQDKNKVSFGFNYIDAVADLPKGLNTLAMLPIGLGVSTGSLVGGVANFFGSLPQYIEPLTKFATDKILLNNIDDGQISEKDKKLRLDLADMFNEASSQLKQSNQEWLEGNGIKRPKNVASGFLFDAGGGLGSLGLVLTNPFVFAPVMSALQGLNLYQEAREEGADMDKSQNIAMVGAVGNLALELVGVKYIQKIASSIGTDLGGKILFGGATGSAEEGVQQTFESGLMNITGIRDETMLEIAKQIGYNSLVGFVVGGVATPALSLVVKEQAVEKGFDEATAQNLGDYVAENADAMVQNFNAPEFMMEFNKLIDEEFSPLKKTPDDAKLVERILDDFDSGREIKLDSVEAQKSRDSFIETFRNIEKQVLDNSELQMARNITDLEASSSITPTSQRPDLLSSVASSREDGLVIADRKKVIELGSVEMGNYRKIKGVDSPMSASRVVNQMERIVGTRLYNRAMKGQALGTFKIKGSGKGAVRSFLHNDVEVFIHEVGHYLDVASNLGINTIYKTPEVASFSYTKNPKLVYLEGFAEFFRAYMTQEKYAREKAPNFYKDFEALLGKNAPDLKKKLHKLQELAHQYMYQGIDFQTKAKLGLGQTNLLDKVKDIMSVVELSRMAVDLKDSIANEIDQFASVKRIEKKTTGEFDPSYGATAWWREFQTSDSIVNNFIENNIFYYNQKGEKVVLGEGLKKVFEPLGKDEEVAQDFVEYLSAKRAIEKHLQGKENPFTEAQLSYMMDKSKKYPDGLLDNVNKKYQEFNSNLVEFLFHSKVLSAEQKQKVLDKNKDFIPFYSSDKGKFLEYKGGTKEIYNIYENIYQNVSALVRLGLMNRAKFETYKLLDSGWEGSAIAIPYKGSVKFEADIDMSNLKEQDAREMKDYLDLIGDQDILRDKSGVAISPDGNFIDTFKIDGSRKYYEIKDPLFSKSMQSLYMKMPDNIVFNSLKTAKKILTSNITLGLDFMVRMFVIDNTIAVLTGKSNNPVKDVYLSARSMITKDDLYKEYMKSAGFYQQKQLGGLSREKKVKSKLGLKKDNIAYKIIDGYINFANALPSINRLTEYRNTIKKGGSEFLASRRAREVGVDFSVMPSNRMLRIGYSAIPFLGATINSFVKIGNEFVEVRNGKYFDADRKRLFTTLGAFSALGILYASLNEEEDWYKSLSSTEKARFWYINKDYRIPKPFQYGFAFGTIPEIVVDAINGGGFDASMKEAIKVGLISYFGAPYSPPLVDIILTGENFVGSKVEKVYEKDYVEWAKYDPTTPDIYLKLGKIYNVSPRKLQMYVDGFVPMVGSGIKHLSDAIIYNNEAYGEAPDFGFKYFNFKDVKPDARTKYNDEYYMLRDKVNASYLSLLKLEGNLKQGDYNALEWLEVSVAKLGGVENFNNLKGEIKQLAGAYRKMDTRLKSVREGELSIARNKNLTGQEKAEAINNLYEARDKALSQYYNAIKENAYNVINLSKDINLQ